MKLLPSIWLMVMTSLFVGMICSLLIAQPMDFATTVTTEHKTTTDDERITGNGTAVYDQPEAVMGSQIDKSTEINWGQFFASFSFTSLIITLICLLLTFWIFRYHINLPRVQQFVNTQLQLAGFNYKIGLLGRKWQITDNLMMELYVENKPKITVELPKLGNPNKFGFNTDSNSRIVVNFGLNQLQIKLQVIRMYLNQ